MSSHMGVLVVKNLPANAGDTRDAASIPRLGRSSGGRNGYVLQYTCLVNPMVPWTEELGGLHSMELQRLRHDWATEHTYTYTHLFAITSWNILVRYLKVFIGTNTFYLLFPWNRLNFLILNPLYKTGIWKFPFMSAIICYLA